MKHFNAETDLARKTVEILQEWGWEVYQEVIGRNGRCDVVGKRGQLLWAVECKLTFGLSVIEQAINWKGQAHYVSISTPSTRYSSRIGNQILRHYGIGHLECKMDHYSETVKPHLNRKIKPIALHEEQKHGAQAGTNGGGYHTPFRNTVNLLIRRVHQKPGIEFKTLITEIDHHYSSLASAKSCLRGFIGTVIPELRFETVDGKLCVFPSVVLK